ncbi:hypothetical protein [uncultured Tateyamaria sp.]|uniref:MotE family protein n=1 Tax=uncultured Tateyamaria sp. TaxID=455651 RepID=UPI00261B3A7C|nr:hypothetical protein [uncultured Tateyamaria sp.]
MATKTRKRRSMAGRGSILLISALLIGSAALRIAIGAGAAVAEADLGMQLVLPTEQSEATKTTSDDTQQVQSLLEALQDREQAVKKKEMALEMRAKALEVTQIEVERRMDALQQTEKQLRSTLALAQTAAEDDLARLTTVYESMKPKDAAALFGAMEPEFAAGFLARMRPDAAAKVMSGLDPQVAYSISAILAGRNAKAPKS